MSSKNSQCEKFVPSLDAFVDNELADSEKSEVVSHLASCDDCRSQIKQIELLKTSLAGLPRRKMSLDLADSFDELLSKSSESQSNHAATSEVSMAAVGQSVAERSNVVPFSARRKTIFVVASAAAVAVIALAGSLLMPVDHSNIANLPADKQPSLKAPNSPAVAPEIADNTSDQNPAVKVAAEDNAGSRFPDTQGAAQHKEAPPVSSAAPQLEKLTASKQLHIHQNTESNSSESANNLVAQGNRDSLQASQTNASVKNSGTNAVAQRERTASNELLALYEEDEGTGADTGITTDEDGLYAIKL